jgi:type IV pilus assembly protein PilA
MTFRHRRIRAFTLVELMIVVAIIGVLAALAVYGVSRHLAASKSAEARNTLGALSRGAQAAYVREITPANVVAVGTPSSGSTQALCDGASPVPSSIAAVQGTKYVPNDGPGKDYNTGDNSIGWRCLRFSLDTAQYFQYNYIGGNAGTSLAAQSAGASPPVSEPGPLQFAAEASGDLNGNGKASLFSLAGKVDPTTKQLVIATAIYENLPGE